jgi:hypothetical protein
VARPKGWVLGKIGFLRTTAPKWLVGKNLILAEIDQTRNIPLADTKPDKEVSSSKGICAMSANHLRVYYGPQEDASTLSIAESQVKRETVTVHLMDVLPLLSDAIQSERTWLRDFADDDMTISMDLYEVLLAYQHYRRPSA